MRNPVLMGVILVGLSFTSSAFAQAPAPSGEAVYKQHCAACHQLGKEGKKA